MLDEEDIMLLGAMFDDELAGDYPDGVVGYDDEELGAFNIAPRFNLSKVRSHRALATRAPVAARRSVSVRHQIAKAAYLNKIAPAIPGVPAIGARAFPLGFGSFTFVNAGVTQTVLTANPQKPFKGARLVIDVRRSSGAVAELLTVTSLNIGQDNQLVSSGALPAEAFAPGAFHTSLSLDPATPGIDITIGLALSAAPGVGETISVSAMLIGETLG